MSAYAVTVRTARCVTRYTAIARSTGAACQAAAEFFADIPCGISVQPVQGGARQC